MVEDVSTIKKDLDGMLTRKLHREKTAKCFMKFEFILEEGIIATLKDCILSP